MRNLTEVALKNKVLVWYFIVVTAIGGIFAVGHWVWCLVIGALIILWIAVGITDLGWINKLTMAALFLLTLVLCKVIFFSGTAMAASGEAMTFGAAVELAVAMARNGETGILAPDYRDTNVSTKVVKLIQSYVKIVNRVVWGN